MYQQTNVLFYKLRFLIAGVLIVTFVVALSALVTTLGSNTVLAGKKSASTGVFDTSLSDSPNLVAAGASSLADGAQRGLLATATALYNGCRSITTAAAQTGKATLHSSAVAIGGAAKGTAFVARGVGSGIMFTLRGAGNATMFMLRTTESAIMLPIRLPGKIASLLPSDHAVSSIIRPAEADNTSVPIISSETSAAALAHYNALQQQEIATLQAGQAAANRGLDGSVVAGDPNHGGYPAKWDAPARQDGQLDSWGMYNRECVSYAAWKVYQTYGNMPYWGGVGNANQWVRDAQKAGIATGSTPRAHSVAISMRGYYGHAMWVEKVSGTMIYVSQYNYDLHGHYSEMWVSASSFTYIYFK